MRGVLLLCLALSFSGPLWAQGAPTSPAVPQSATYESELSRLKVIFARLSAISMQLDAKLANSEQALTKLSDELATLRLELEGLRTKLGESLQESEALAEMLERSAISLERALESFRAYRIEAEAKIRRLKWIAALGVGTGAAFGVWGLTR